MHEITKCLDTKRKRYYIYGDDDLKTNYITQKRKKAKETINYLMNNGSHLLLIHYSCESFNNVPSGYTPRVTSIAVRYYNTAQTKSFTIHRIAEIKRIPFEEIEKNYDVLEKEMLKEFFSFMESHKSYNWLHWNMRDFNYGFEAIENRYKVLGGTPEILEDNKKYDLARLLITIYGANYAEHPRLENLIVKNGMSDRGFLEGAAEAEAFQIKEFAKLHQSTLKKVDVFHSIVDKVASRKLKTDARWHEPYGLSLQAIYESIKNHWFYDVAILIIGAILGAIVSSVIN